MASISGNVVTAGGHDAWIAAAYDAETHALAGSSAVSGGSYIIAGLTAGKAYFVAVRPVTGDRWTAGRTTSQGQYTVPTNPTAKPYIFQATEAASGDGYYPSVSTLLHFNGANNSTAFTDQTGKTWTPAGNTKISTAQSVFGGASGFFDGTGDGISTPGNVSFQLGTGDFTIEMFIHPTSNAANMDFIAHRHSTDDNNFWFARRGTAGSIRFYNKLNGAVIWDITTSGDTTDINAWSHVACVRNGTRISVFIDGVERGSATSSSIMAYINYPVLIGAGDNGLLGGMIGYIDECRITKGVARYTGAFTPPASEFPNSAGSITGTNEPAWPETAGATIDDNGIIWTNKGRLLRPLKHGPLIAT